MSMSFNAEVLIPVLFGLAALVLSIKAALNWPGDKFLCDDCRYNNADDCKKNERPAAVKCLAYRRKSN